MVFLSFPDWSIPLFVLSAISMATSAYRNFELEVSGLHKFDLGLGEVAVGAVAFFFPIMPKVIAWSLVWVYLGLYSLVPLITAVALNFFASQKKGRESKEDFNWNQRPFTIHLLDSLSGLYFPLFPASMASINRRMNGLLPVTFAFILALLSVGIVDLEDNGPVLSCSKLSPVPSDAPDAEVSSTLPPPSPMDVILPCPTLRLLSPCPSASFYEHTYLAVAFGLVSIYLVAGHYVSDNFYVGKMRKREKLQEENKRKKKDRAIQTVVDEDSIGSMQHISTEDDVLETSV